MAIDRIGVVGLGSMGFRMAQRLLDGGYDVTASSRSQDKLALIAAYGARTVTLPADAAQDADLVIVSVRGQRAVDEVLFDHGSIGETLRDGGYILDTSTTSPEFSQAATGRLAGYGLVRLEGCILGDPVRARAGKLRMLLGGSEDDLRAVAEVVATLASSVVHAGAVGTASRLQAMHQALLADGYPATADALLRELSSRPTRVEHQPPTDTVGVEAFDVLLEGVGSS